MIWRDLGGLVVPKDLVAARKLEREVLLASDQLAAACKLQREAVVGGGVRFSQKTFKNHICFQNLLLVCMVLRSVREPAQVTHICPH